MCLSRLVSSGSAAAAFLSAAGEWAQLRTKLKTDLGHGLCWLLVLFVTASFAHADLPRTPLKERPRLLGREVEELVLKGTIPVGQPLPPGLPTTTTYKMTPNRFRPVSEDAEGIFYQAIGPLEKHLAWRRGGVYLSIANPDKMIPYLGDAGQFRFPVGMFDPLHPGHVRMFRVRYVVSNRGR